MRPPFYPHTDSTLHPFPVDSVSAPFTPTSLPLQSDQQPVGAVLPDIEQAQEAEEKRWKEEREGGEGRREKGATEAVGEVEREKGRVERAGESEPWPAEQSLPFISSTVGMDGEGEVGRYIVDGGGSQIGGIHQTLNILSY